MKREYLKHLLALLVALFASVSANAYDAYVDGIYYNLDANAQQATVTYKGERYYSDKSYSGSVTIPSTVVYEGATYDVTMIGDYAFYSCSGLTSINLPSSVTSIENSAFTSCTGLTSIIVAAENSVFDSRNNCNAIIETATNTLIQGCCNTIIPNTVTSIGNSAFYLCSGLTSVDIPSGVTSIGERAFYHCYNLTSIALPESLTSIASNAFESCSKLSSISVAAENTIYDSRNDCNAIIETATNTLVQGCCNTIIPNTVTSIGNSAFYLCSGLTSIDIPSSVTSIGEQAFYNCNNLTSIILPERLTDIGSGAFSGCI